MCGVLVCVKVRPLLWISVRKEGKESFPLKSFTAANMTARSKLTGEMRFSNRPWLLLHVRAEH